MKICAYCGRENVESALACNACGTEFEREGLVPIHPLATFFAKNAANFSRVGAALLVTLGVVVLGLVASIFVGPLVFMLLMPATALWATFDVLKLRRQYQYDASPFNDDILALLQCSKPIIVFTVCFTHWILAFPWYLVIRDVLMTNTPDRKTAVSQIH